jgi:membrane-bound serine protease (ClpP class)
LALIFAARMHGQASQAANTENVVELQLNGQVEPILAEYIAGGISKANESNASLILITIDTPGGLDTSMRQIIQAILTSKVPVVAYVSPTGARAASAGFFILLSADVAAMSPGTETGAASPILAIGGSTVQIDETLRKKIVNDATAYLRSYVAKRDRDTDLAATAVTDAKAFSDKEALDGKLIDLVATSREELLAKLNGRTIKRFDGASLTLALPQPTVTTRSMTGRERFLSRIVQPDVFFILFIVGILGLYTEFTHPGLFAPGVFGAICSLLALYAAHLLPISFTGVLLIICSLVLFALEAKYPTHGVLGVGGVIAMILGGLFLIPSPITGMGIRLGTLLAVVIPFALISIFLARLVMRSRQWKAATGKEELIGMIGDVTEHLGEAGKPGMVLVRGELWRAVASNGAPIAKGAQVKIKAVKGLTLEVDLVSQRATAS